MSSGPLSTQSASLIQARNRAIAGLPVIGKRRHDAADAILDLYEAAEEFREEAERLRAALERVYQIGRGPHVTIAREALDA